MSADVLRRYLHLGFKAPERIAKRSRVCTVWAILRLRHPMLCARAELYDYGDVRFMYVQSLLFHVGVTHDMMPFAAMTHPRLLRTFIAMQTLTLSIGISLKTVSNLRITNVSIR